MSKLVKNAVTGGMNRATHDPVTGLELVQAASGGQSVLLSMQVDVGRNAIENEAIRRHKYVIDSGRLAVRPGDIDPHQEMSEDQAHALAVCEALHYYEQGWLSEGSPSSRVLLDDISAKWLPGQAPLSHLDVSHASSYAHVHANEEPADDPIRFTGPSHKARWDAAMRFVSSEMTPTKRAQREYIDTLGSLMAAREDWIKTGRDTREEWAYMENLSPTNRVLHECDIKEMCDWVDGVDVMRKDAQPRFDSLARSRVELWMQSQMREKSLGGRLSPYTDDGWKLITQGRYVQIEDVHTGFENGALVRNHVSLPDTDMQDAYVGFGAAVSREYVSETPGSKSERARSEQRYDAVPSVDLSGLETISNNDKEMEF